MHSKDRHITHRALLAAAIAMAPMAGQVWAQSSEDEFELNAIVVSDERTAEGDTPAPAYAGGQVAAGGRAGILGEQDASDVPFSVISFTEELIDNQQADTLSDVLLNDASIQSGFGYGNFSEKFYIRGFELNGEDISYGGLYGVLPRQIIDLDVAGRVELFKGANAFTNGIAPGSSGIGGVVNIEPKRAADEALNRVTVGYETEDYREVGVDVGRRFGSQNEYGVRISAKSGKGDTAIDHENRQATAAVVGLDYRGDRSRASFDFGYQNQEVEGGRSVVYIGDVTEIPDAPDADTNYAPRWAYSGLETTFGMLRGEYDLTDAWTAYAAVGANNTHESGEYSSPTVNDADGNATASRLGVPYQAKSVGSQAGLRGRLATGPVSHQVNLGYSGIYRKTSSAYTFGSSFATNIYDPADPEYPATTFSGGNLSDPNVRSRIRTDGVALADTLGFLDDNILLTLGTRYQEVEVINYSYDGIESDRFNDYTMTPVYGVVVKPVEGISLYANHVESLLPGDTAPTEASNSGQTIGVIEAQQNEIGAKFDYGRIGGAISLFQIEKPEAFLNTDTGVYGYYGEQRNRGLELSLYGEPVDGIRLISSATWLDPEITEAENDANEGQDAVGVPEYRYVVSGEWDLPGVNGWTALGKVIRNGPQYADPANELEVDAWTRLDLGVRYTMPMNSSEIVWRANVENVADENYWASAGGGYLTQGEPRTIKLSAELNF